MVRQYVDSVRQRLSFLILRENVYQYHVISVKLYDYQLFPGAAESFDVDNNV